MFRLAAALVLTAAALTAQTVVRAIPAKVLLESFGVNVHMEYTDSQYADVKSVAIDLAYLGISLVRNNVPAANWGPEGQGVAAIHSLAERGIKFDICLLSTDLARGIEEIEALENFHPGTVAAVEGPNEIDNTHVVYKGLAGQAAADEFQKDAYRRLHASPTLRAIPVYHFTGGETVSGASLSGMADFANAHPYAKGANPPRRWLEGDFSRQYKDLGAVPKVVTETGYHTAPGGVNEDLQAKLLLTTYFTAAELGISKTYVYQLLDAYADSSGKDIDRHFGLFDVQQRAKLSAIAMHNLTSYLRDSGVKHASLDYGLKGLPPSAHSLLLSKSDGSFVLALWNEQLGPSITGELCLTRSGTIQPFDPLTREAPKAEKVRGCRSVRVADYPTLISIKQDR